jgi:peptidoglycan/LPS O-acetylase OafA/YrhL
VPLEEWASWWRILAERLEKRSGGLTPSTPPRGTYKTPDPRAHYVELDALRGIAILMVAISHITVYWGQATRSSLPVPLLGVDLLRLLLFGYLGVPLFFLLSGYLLTWTEEGRKRRGSYSILNYAKRRVLRIVPAYYAIIALTVLLGVLLFQVDPPFETVAIHLTFLQGFKPSYPAGLDAAYWSLTPEIVFYAMLPLLVLKFRKLRQRIVILALLLLVSLATRLLMAYDVNLLPMLDVSGEVFGRNRMYFFPTTPLYLFLVGMLLRMMVERRNEAGRGPGRRQLFVASVLTVVPAALLSVFPYLIMPQGKLLGSPWAMIAETMVISMFASALLGSPILKPILKWGLLTFFGRISYSLFLLHGTVILVILAYVLPAVAPGLADQGGLTVWATFVAYAFVVLAVSGTLAYLSFRYIESPFLRIKPK